MIVLVSPKTQKIDTKNANFLAEIITKLLPEKEKGHSTGRHSLNVFSGLN